MISITFEGDEQVINGGVLDGCCSGIRWSAENSSPRGVVRPGKDTHRHRQCIRSQPGVPCATKRLRSRKADLVEPLIRSGPEVGAGARPRDLFQRRARRVTHGEGVHDASAYRARVVLRRRARVWPSKATNIDGAPQKTGLTWSLGKLRADTLLTDSRVLGSRHSGRTLGPCHLHPRAEVALQRKASRGCIATA